MADIVTAQVRSRMMSGIRGTDTAPELALRGSLHRLGFRYRLHARSLPGKPDMVFPKRRAVLFAHGCFWHGHDCHLFKWPSTRPDFWKSKITRNRENDAKHEAQLLALGWRHGVVWECALKGKARLPLRDVISGCSSWLRSERQQLEIRGTK
jgi:DNA mismatch endonuclease (patch repair protein)